MLPPPLDLVAMMVLENGMRWGDQATDQQWADMKALLEPAPGEPLRHFWLRPRGGSKTFDTGAATIAIMLAGRTKAGNPVGPGDEMYAAAAGREQAGLLAVKMAAITRNTPELAGLVEVQQKRVLTPTTGAVLDILSSEEPGAWGKTPFWLFIDEMCNHENSMAKRGFVTTLLSAVPKRPGECRCLIASTPSDENHWSWPRWERAQQSRLWRASHVPGPVPWWLPEDIEEEGADLLDFEYKRLILCQWASPDDTVADDEALARCTRAAPHVLPPDGGTEYLVTWDIGWAKDHSAVCVCHMGQRAGRHAVIIDLLRAWQPTRGHQVRVSEVLDFAEDCSRRYNGAPLYGDPTEAVQRIQDWKEAGFIVRPADTGATANSVRAKTLLRLVRDGGIEIPEDPVLRKEFLSLRLAEGNTPGVVRLSSDGSSKGHHDRVTAILYGAGEMIARPGWTWRNYNGDLVTCPQCSRSYLKAMPACRYCGTANPDPATPKVQLDAASIPYVPQPGSWAAAYIGDGAKRCGAGHVYRGEQCDRCRQRSGLASLGVPAAFTRALAIGGRR